MRFFRSLLGLAATTPLLLTGCTQPTVEAPATPVPGAPSNTEAVNRRIEELKKENPSLPPSALATRASMEVQQQKAQGGGAR